MTETKFPLLDDTGKPRKVTLKELQDLAGSLAIHRTEQGKISAIRDLHSDKTDAIVQGNVPMPNTIIIIRDREYVPCVYSSNDDITASLIYYGG